MRKANSVIWLPVIRITPLQLDSVPIAAFGVLGCFGIGRFPIDTPKTPGCQAGTPRVPGVDNPVHYGCWGAISKALRCSKQILPPGFVWSSFHLSFQVFPSLSKSFLVFPSCKSVSAPGEAGSLLVMFQMAAPMQGPPIVSLKPTFELNMGQLRNRIYRGFNK